MCLCFPFQDQQILPTGRQANRTASVHHLTHNVISLYQQNNTDMKFVCLCFLLSKYSLGRSTSPQLLPHGVIHTLMNDVKDVYEEMSVHLPWDVTDGLEQSIILPRSTIGLSTAAPSRIVSCQGGPCFSVFPCCNISGNLSPGLKTKERRDGKLSPFETSERLKLWLV